MVAKQYDIKAVKIGDYVVADLNNKPSLVRILGINGDDMRGKHEYKDQEDDVEINMLDVKANLGTDPQIGRVYSCNTERLIGITDTKPIQQVDWYFTASDEIVESIHSGIMSGAKLLRKHDIHRILKIVKARVVLNTAKKLSAKSIIGSYQCKGGNDENPDIITLKYHKDMLEHLPRLLVHEAGHGIWSHLISNKLKAQWIYTFFKQAEIVKTDAETTDLAIRTAVKERSIILVEPELQAALTAVMARVEQTSGLRAKDIFMLLQTNTTYAKAVLGPWRDYPVAEGTWETHVTEYADTNVEELWCESLANFCTGLGLPEYLKELFAETLEYCKGRDVFMYSENVESEGMAKGEH